MFGRNDNCVLSPEACRLFWVGYCPCLGPRVYCASNQNPGYALLVKLTSRDEALPCQPLHGLHPRDKYGTAEGVILTKVRSE